MLKAGSGCLGFRFKVGFRVEGLGCIDCIEFSSGFVFTGCSIGLRAWGFGFRTRGLGCRVLFFMGKSCPQGLPIGP